MPILAVLYISYGFFLFFYSDVIQQKHKKFSYFKATKNDSNLFNKTGTY